MIDERSSHGSQAMRITCKDLIPIGTGVGLTLCNDNNLRSEEYGFQVKTEYKREGYSDGKVEALRIDWP